MVFKIFRTCPSSLLLFPVLYCLVVPVPAQVAGGQPGVPFRDPKLPIDRRVDDLVSRMTLEEKVSQMMNGAEAIERLGVPEYEWWNEALHGVARAGIATVFPQAIGLAATFDEKLIQDVGDVTSTEARAKHHEFVRRGERKRYQGLTFWSPNINIFRDPRWGRGQETWGEDPYLSGLLGSAFVRGLQGNDAKYLKVVSTVKHFAVHSGPEPERHSFDAVVSEHDLQDTYLPQFRMTIVDAKAAGVMCAYNRVNGDPACASKELSDILFNKWKFDGHVVSDCGAIDNIFLRHKYVPTEEQASAIAVKGGTDLTCGREYRSLVKAVKERMISEAEIDKAVKNLMKIRFRLGMFDPPEMVKYAKIPFSMNDAPSHHELSLEASRRSLVLLKNQSNILPLRKDLKTIAVIGPNADDRDVLLGNYNGDPSVWATPLAGIKKIVSPTTQVLFSQGVLPPDKATSPADLRADAIEKAKQADAVIMVMGISPRVEGEEMKVKLDGFRGGDRTDISLPKPQEQLIKEIHALGKPVVLVTMGGSALALNWENENLPAIIHAWYPGQFGGTAIAETIFGDYNPAGRLPVTFYKSVDQLPPFDDYRMDGRTYRYFRGEPLFPFGYGLSYSQFIYSQLRIPSTIRSGRNIALSVNVQNVSKIAGDEVVQVYLADKTASTGAPIRSMVGVQRVHLRPGESRKVSFTVNPRQMSVVLASGNRVLEPGEFEISVGGGQPNATTKVLTGTFKVMGSSLSLEQ